MTRWTVEAPPGPPVEGSPQGRWHPETFVCAFRGHYAPATVARRLRDGDWLVGVTATNGGHPGRCLRCDAWVLADPAAADRDDIGGVDDLVVPERGKQLRDSLVLKLIAVDRGVHSVVFALLAVGLLAVGLLFLRSHLGALQSQAATVVRNAGAGLSGTGQDSSRGFLVGSLHRILGLSAFAAAPRRTTT